MKKKKSPRVTLQDVANHAGVSRATASLIVRNSPKVSEKTRDKVLQSMEELGYVYDRVAANLRSKKSMTIGTIITDVGNTSFAQFLLGVHQTLERYGYTVLLGTTFDSPEEQDRLISTMLEYRVDGIILCPASNSSDAFAKNISALRIPLVVGVGNIQQVPCDFVGADYELGAWKATSLLIQKGHQRIAFVGANEQVITWAERVAGYQRAHEESGVMIEPSLIVSTSPFREGGNLAVQQLMADPDSEPPSAIICFNDLVAFGVMVELRKLGLEPGVDVDVIGYGNTPEAEGAFPPLTSINTFSKVTGEKAAELLHQRIRFPKKERARIIIEPELVIRDSACLDEKISKAES